VAVSSADSAAPTNKGHAGFAGVAVSSASGYAGFLDAGAEKGEQVSQRVKLLAAVAEEPYQPRKLSRVLVGGLAGELCSVLSDSALEPLALRVE
jgi:hypothetical protein